MAHWPRVLRAVLVPPNVKAMHLVLVLVSSIRLRCKIYHLQGSELANPTPQQIWQRQTFKGQPVSILRQIMFPILLSFSRLFSHFALPK